jgi:hypothetical protein
LLAVDEDAWENSWNSLPICSGGIRYRERNPIPVILLSMTGIDRNGATLGKLVGVAHEIEERLPQAHLIGMHRPDLAIAA